jgi:hypothetical protein
MEGLSGERAQAPLVMKFFPDRFKYLPGVTTATPDEVTGTWRVSQRTRQRPADAGVTLATQLVHRFVAQIEETDPTDVDASSEHDLPHGRS